MLSSLDKSKVIRFARDFMSAEKLSTVGDWNKKRTKLLSSLASNQEVFNLAAAAVDTDGMHEKNRNSFSKGSIVSKVVIHKKSPNG